MTNDLNEEFIESLYDDELKKYIIEVISNNESTSDEKIQKMIDYMAIKGIK